MQIVKFDNPGAIIDRMPNELLAKVKVALKEKREQTNTLDTVQKRNLQILSVKEIDDTPYVKELDEFIRKTYLKWCKAFDVESLNIEIPNVWTNYMRSGEYIQIHNHASDISFVIWINIPYNRKEEEKYHFEHIDQYPKIQSYKKNNNGTFKFMYSTFCGTLSSHVIDLSKKNEGDIIMFHSSLYHVVYPFFSTDEERISIAGNINRV